MIQEEDVPRELEVPLRITKLTTTLPIPVPMRGYRVEGETWTLKAEPLGVSVDLSPQIVSVAAGTVATARIEERTWVDFNDSALDVDALRAELAGYKAARGHGNVYVPRDELLPILQVSSLFMHRQDAQDPGLIQEGALRVLKTYLERFVSRKEREAESRRLEPGSLKVSERVVRYRVRVSSEELLREIEALLRRPTDLYSDGGRPLPRLHFDQHLFNPLLLSPDDFGLADISVSLPGLGKGEAKFLKDLREFWRGNHVAEPYRGMEIFLFRNLPRIGVGFFRRSGFYPDFIVWIKDRKSKTVLVRFIEPHGMHHGGLAGNREKIEALKELREMSRLEPFRARKITLGGYLLTQTPLEKIPDGRDKTWEELERDHKVLRQEGSYIPKILALG